MKIVAVVPYRSLRIAKDAISLCDVFPRFRFRAGDNIAFSVAVVMFAEEGDRGDYRLTIEMTDPIGEVLYRSAIDVPTEDAGHYIMQIQNVVAEVVSPGLYHLDVSLGDEAVSLPVIFFEVEEPQ